MGSLPLIEINLEDNLLTGSIPRSIDSSRSLQRLYLFNNSLTGVIPSELCESPLVFLYASGNPGLDCYEPCVGSVAEEDFTSELPMCTPPTCE